VEGIILDAWVENKTNAEILEMLQRDHDFSVRFASLEYPALM
jgi:hypothetical protein